MEGKSGASSRGNSAPIAYAKVVAVKKLVVGSQSIFLKDFWSVLTYVEMCTGPSALFLACRLRKDGLRKEKVFCLRIIDL